MSYSVEATTANCYENSSCLINKFNIKNERQLSIIENGITLKKTSELLGSPIPQKLDFNHYKYIHKYLFEDIYDWAGKLRTINISKKGTNFCNVSELEKLCQCCFDRLEHNNYFKNVDKATFIDEIVDFYCSTNILHPFREGNGRTQRIFITQLIRFNGYHFDFAEIDTDELMIATIQSANDVVNNLKTIFEKSIY